jgi:hypothetical protein
VKDSPGQRVSVCDKEIVILKQTSTGEYHGYKTTWDDLVKAGKKTRKIIKTLRKSCLVNANGKIQI